ncbi:hypothetical protein C2G38_2157041 [Gigaspora rosea]|uniref:Uncharacterized protein n=1 Tax=Gigaspora rosea TaxID=44941 RepID=A0A397W5E7_9GLOM|nr:hypothetical protein C2G38_2157041 [Gigaspora rosea]
MGPFERLEILFLITNSDDHRKQSNAAKYSYRAWCQRCDTHKLIHWWTSGNKDIDDYIKEFQLKTASYEDIIEWIPFNRFENVQNNSDGILQPG